jgi:hypothetical protein
MISRSAKVKRYNIEYPTFTKRFPVTIVMSNHQDPMNNKGLQISHSIPLSNLKTGVGANSIFFGHKRNTL